MSIYAVNGKAPIAAWIPSLDTAGNGTTTLTDLVGSNNGTLTNMDPATDWVADTDAGGVRALDFDGVDDRVVVPHSAAITMSGSLSVSSWIKPITQINNAAFTCKGTVAQGWLIYGAQSSSQILFGLHNGAYRQIGASNVYTVGVWRHIVATYSSADSRMRLYVDGTLRASLTTTGNITAGTTDLFIAALPGNLAHANIRQDDARLFNQALDADDVSALYAAGLGRGITFGGTTMQTRRRRDLGGFGL